MRRFFCLNWTKSLVRWMVLLWIWFVIVHLILPAGKVAFIEPSFSLRSSKWWCCIIWTWVVHRIGRWNLTIVSFSALFFAEHFVRFHNLLEFPRVQLLTTRFTRIWMILNWLLMFFVPISSSHLSLDNINFVNEFTIFESLVNDSRTSSDEQLFFSFKTS